MKNLGRYNFYGQQWRRENARIIFSLVLEILPKINSAVDFGCGLGYWLSVLKEFGVNDIKGYDGHWTDKESLEIPKECFEAINLENIIAVEKRYDLAISIEVAEHLPEKSAEAFIQMLTKSSDIILFSAAIPYQGGTNHINLQWQDYWHKLFHSFGYMGIDIRKLLWNDTKVKTWYKQNMILYVQKNKIEQINVSKYHCGITDQCLNIVHPETYIEKAKKHIQNMPLTQLYKEVIKRTIKRIRRKGLGNLSKILKNKNGT